MSGRPGPARRSTQRQPFTDACLTDESFSLVNFHMGSGIGGVLLMVAVLGLGGMGYGLARLRNRRKDLARCAATTLDVIKSPA